MEQQGGAQGDKEKEKEKELKTFLQAHSAFNLVTDVESANQQYVRNLVAHNISSDELLVFNPKSSKLVVVALNSWSKSRVEQTQELTLEPAPPDGIRQLLCHKNGRLVCLVGTNRCAIVDLSDKLRSKFYTSNAPLSCRVKNVGAYLHSSKPSTRVLQVEWHPLSDSHFGVLTSDNALRLYNESNLEDCEQTFHLFSLTSVTHSSTPTPSSRASPHTPVSPYIPSPHTPSRYDTQSPHHRKEREPSRHEHVPEAVAFSFGAGNGWTALSVFFLSQKGDIYYISPVIPHYCRLPKSLLSTLTQITLGKIRVLKEMASDEVLPNFEYYNAHLKWLSEIQGTDMSKDLADLSLSGHNMAGFVDTYPPAEKLNLVLQGPMDKDYPGEPPNNRVKPCGLVYVPYDSPSNLGSLSSLPSPTIGYLAKIFAGGVVDILINIVDTAPRWAVKNQPISDTFVPQLLFYDQIKLDIPQTAVNNRPTPYILVSNFHPFHLFIVDAIGIFSLQLVWLEQLRQFIDSQADPSDLPELPPSQLTRIANSTSFGDSRVLSPLGLAVFSPGTSGYFALVLSGACKCTCIGLTVENAEPPSKKVWHGVTRPLRKEPVPYEALMSPTPLNQPHEVLAVVRRATAHLRKEYIGYITGCEEDAQANFTAINNEITEQVNNLNAEQQKINDLVQQRARIERRINGCLRVQEGAEKRIANIFAITSTTKSLSKAERDFFKELYEYYYLTHTKLRSRLEELGYQTERQLRKLAEKGEDAVQQVPLDEEQLEQITNALQEQYQVITQNVQGLKELDRTVTQALPENH